MAPVPRMRLKVSVRIPRNAITRAVGCLVIGSSLAKSAGASEIAEGWWAPGDPPPASFGFAEGSRVLPDGRTAYRIHFRADPTSQALVTRSDHRQRPPPTGYRLPETGGAILTAIAESSPRAGHVVLGHSVAGRPIDAVWMGQPPGSGAPVFRILGGHHGDEWTSFEVPLALAEALAAGDGLDPEITAILDETTVWIAPYINPDGVLEGSRYNANIVDLNRNYDFAWDPQAFLPGEAPFSEPETRAVRAHGHYDLPLAGLTFHSGATNIGYVWNYTTEPATDRELALDLATGYADQTADPDFWVTNGASWYITNGDTNDWSYGRYGVLDFTVELTEEKAPPPSELLDVLPAHLDATLSFLTHRPTLSGTVTDATSGRPVMAQLTAETTAPFFSDPISGRFHRIAPDGPLEIGITAPGYEDVVVSTQAPDLELHIALDRRDGLQPGAWPVITSPTTLDLPDAWTGVVTLHRPGTPSVSGVATSGTLGIDPDGLPRGAWTVAVGDQTWIRGVILADALLPEPTLQGSDILFPGDYAAGTRAWALFGPDRALHPLPVLDRTEDWLRLDGAAVDDTLWADVILLSGGHHLARIDIFDTVATSSPIQDDPIIATPVGCTCATQPGHRAVFWLSALMFPLIRRRSS